MITLQGTAPFFLEKFFLAKPVLYLISDMIDESFILDYKLSIKKA